MIVLWREMLTSSDQQEWQTCSDQSVYCHPATIFPERGILQHTCHHCKTVQKYLDQSDKCRQVRMCHSYSKAWFTIDAGAYVRRLASNKASSNTRLEPVSNRALLDASLRPYSPASYCEPGLKTTNRYVTRTMMRLFQPGSIGGGAYWRIRKFFVKCTKVLWQLTITVNQEGP